MESPTKIILIVVIALIVIGTIAGIYIIKQPKPINETQYNRTTFNIKVFDKYEPIDAKYFIVEENKAGEVKKDFVSQISLIPRNNYTLYVTADGHYSKKVTYIPQININTIDIELTKIGSLNVKQSGSVKENKLTLDLSTDDEIHELSYCVFLSNNIINAFQTTTFEVCAYNWLNFGFNDTFNQRIDYFKEGVYRCPYSYESINRQDYKDKMEFCEEVKGNYCYKGTIPIPDEYERKTVKCFSLGDLPRTINLELKTSNPTDEDFVQIYYFDKDLKLNNGQFIYEIGKFAQNKIYK